jgi:6-pyruvoyl-tetrahydropterin synthase
MCEIEAEREFSAAHQLKNCKGNCSFLHGHNQSGVAHLT